MRIAVIGGGINGLCTAECLAEHGHQVALFERGSLMAETSRNSSKLLHGGLRYLETFEFGLVAEALRERAWWLEHCPQHTRALQLTLPVYDWQSRPAWQVGLGIRLYHWLAGRRRLGDWQRLDAGQLRKRSPDLRSTGLRAAFTFYDGQMDDHALGLWIAARARERGVRIEEHCPVHRVTGDGDVEHAGGGEHFDRVVNVAGPWAEQLLLESGLAPRHHLQWVRGSHLLFAGECRHGWLLQAPQDARVFFVLPWQGHTLVGTTEVAQEVDAPIAAAEREIDYLLTAYNHYFEPQRGRADIVDTFAGVRPLLRSDRGLNAASREAVVDRNGRLVTVFGGKWTSARALARKVARCTER
jgi:glycerol-3-phosphate dehydrogenase